MFLNIVIVLLQFQTTVLFGTCQYEFLLIAEHLYLLFFFENLGIQ